ncbi:MAG: hypothetical protein QGI86_21660 [Candidatus Poribacteria bacterium]|nr:hypothetical protein [Candidatus Poribacteria bacterium]MDP6750345.1 hypothetical protein [Candidatus Poribacteria bacterium]MDP6995054.1 hypothetical protein [Candidatus Poribacteria bacterium]
MAQTQAADQKAEESAQREQDQDDHRPRACHCAYSSMHYASDGIKNGTIPVPIQEAMV